MRSTLSDCGAIPVQQRTNILGLELASSFDGFRYWGKYNLEHAYDNTCLIEGRQLSVCDRTIG